MYLNDFCEKKIIFIIQKVSFYHYKIVLVQFNTIFLKQN